MPQEGETSGFARGASISGSDGHHERIAAAVCERIERGCDEYRAYWLDSAPVRHFVVDDLLPEPLIAEHAQWALGQVRQRCGVDC